MHLQAENTVHASAERGGAGANQLGDAHLVKKVAELGGNVLLWDNGRLDVDSEQGQRALRYLLKALHTAHYMLRVPQASRDYRRTLPGVVHATWTDAECLYHIGILTSSVNGEVYYNSRAYPLSDDTVVLACQLGERLSGLLGLLGHLHRTGTEDVTVSDVADLRACLVAFDEGWASFEERFFVDLLNIESQARASVVEAVGLVRALDRIAGNHEQDVDPKILMQDPDFSEKHCRLIRCVARLNSEVNPGNVARSFAPEVLQQAEALVEDYLSSGGSEACSVFVLASDAICAWDDLCVYLYQVAPFIDNFSPDLRRSKTLVKLLEFWSTSWALAEAYVVDKPGCLALRTTLQYILDAKTVTPALVGMMDDMSAELFLVLPRMVLLCFLEHPLCVGPLLARLLPHRFEELRDDGGSRAPLCPKTELAALVDAYRQTLKSLAVSASSAMGPQSKDAQTLVQAMLTSSIVNGIGDRSTLATKGIVVEPLCGKVVLTASILDEVGDTSALATEGIFDPPASGRAKDACTSFLIKLEGWSMELQRHCAQDWNHFVATLLRCLEPQAATTSACTASEA